MMAQYPSRRAFRVWQRNRDVFLSQWRAEAVPAFVEPLFVLFAMGLGLGGYVALGGSESYLDFIAPGIVASYAMFSASFECAYGSFFRMETQKTYDAIIATPLNIEDVIAGEIFWAATRALITATVIMIVILPLGLVHSWLALLVLPLALMEGLMFGSLAMFFTSIAPSVYSFNYFFTLFITPLFLLGEVFFPLSAFPPLMQQLAWFLPLTPVAQITRGLVGGQIEARFLLNLAWIALIAATFFALALVMMRRRLIK